MLHLPTRFRRPTRPTEPRADDHVAATVSPPKADEGDRPTPAPPTPPEPSQPLPIGPVWPSERTWLNAALTTRDQIREERILHDLAKLTDDHTPLKAAQILFAPELRKDARA